ncbi:MAG: PHB depolymerase family esterase [Anaerolineae bacterium]
MQTLKGTGGTNRFRWQPHTLILVLTAAVFLATCGGRGARSAVSPTPAGDYSDSMTVGALERTYLLHIPTGYTAARAWPLVILLHGGGGTGKEMMTHTRGGMNALADQEGFIVAYPDGIDKQWNDGRQLDQVRAMRENIDDVGFLSALIDRLIDTRNVDSHRVYAAGISNGGMMTERIACELTGKLAAIGIVAAPLSLELSTTCKPTGPIPVVLMAGVADPLVPYGGGEIKLLNIERGQGLSIPDTIRFWTTNAGCAGAPTILDLPDTDPKDGTRVRRETYDSCRAQSAVILYTITGGGHTWPGGAQYLPEAIVGKVSRDMDANLVLWEFFKRFER